MVKDTGNRGELNEEGPRAGGVPWEEDKDLYTGGLLGIALRINVCVRRRGRRLGWKKKLGHVTGAMKASAKLMGTSEVGIGPQSYPELEQGG